VLRSNSKSLGNHVVSPGEDKERLQWEGFAEKEGFRAQQTGAGYVVASVAESVKLVVCLSVRLFVTTTRVINSCGTAAAMERRAKKSRRTGIVHVYCGGKTLHGLADFFQR